MPRPERVLFVDHAAALGGAERSLLLLLQHLHRSRWTPHLVGVAGPLLTEAAAGGTAVHPVTLPRLRRSGRFLLDWWRGARAISRLAREMEAAVLVANTVRAALYTAPAAWLARRPFVWYMRDFWLSESRPERLWPDRLGKRLLLAASRCVIANSEATAGHLPASPKVRVVYNAVESGRFDPKLDGSEFRWIYGIPAAAPLVGMAGRLRPWKGQLRFLQMAALVRRARPGTRFVIVGGDPFGVEDDYAARVESVTRELGLQEAVCFTDQLTDVRPALAALDVFVHPGDPEPFGLVNIEAMAMARPVVAFAHGALPEIVAHGETGLLVEPDDVTALAAAVTALLGDPERGRMMGRAGRARVEKMFTAERMAAEVEAVLAEVIGGQQ